MASHSSAKSSPRKVVEVAPRPRRAKRLPKSASPRLQVLQPDADDTKQAPLDTTQKSGYSPQKTVDLTLPRLEQIERRPPCDLANSARSLGQRNQKRELEGSRFPTWSPSTWSHSTPPRHVSLVEKTERKKDTVKELPVQRIISKTSTSAVTDDVHALGFDSMENIMLLAKRSSTTIAKVKKAMEEFRKADENQNGSLSLDEFMDAVRIKFGWSQEQEFPDDFVMTHWKTADANSNLQIDFREYLNWAICTEWSEHAMVPDERDRELRQISRELGLQITDLEFVRRIFDKFDEDKSDTIEENEFRVMICELTSAQASSVSPQLLKVYWNEVLKAQANHVTFHEFVGWWFQIMVR